MPVLLHNQRNPQVTLILTHSTWLGVLDLAVAYGWNSLGAVLPGHWVSIESSLGDYLPGYLTEGDDERSAGRPVTPRLVLLEDALNLADALEAAFIDYEPRRLRATTLLYAIEDPAVDLRPSIGAIKETLEFCRQGAFWIELYRSAYPV